MCLKRCHGKGQGRLPVAEPGESGHTAAMESGIGVAAVARRLGVAPATLRTWDRRYGLGPSVHIEGSHRRYTGADLGRLEHMQRLVRAGVAPRDAATAALNSPSPAAEVAVGPFVQSEVAPSATAAVRGLRRAAAALDVDTTSRLIGDQIERRGVVWTWDHVIVPVLVVFGEGWAATGKGLEAEHALSEVVSAAFARVCFENSARLRDRPVLLAAGPEDLHTLPLEATAAALAERGVGSRFLGARVPFGSLASAIRRTGPKALLVWSTTPTPVIALGAIGAIRPNPWRAIAGPGWGTGTPAGWVRFWDLSSAVTQLAAWVAT
jgi:DNA-binding transcriptional MerR regulator